MKDIREWYDSRSHRDYIERWQRQEEYYRTIQEPRIANAAAYMRLYLNMVKDERGEDELWRADVRPTSLVSAIDTKVASLVNILIQGDPPIQARGSTNTAHRVSYRVERLLEHALYINQFPALALNIVHMASILGSQPIQVGWQDVRVKNRIPVTPEERLAWEEMLRKAEMLCGLEAPDAVTAPEAFELFRIQVNSGYGANLPPYPRDDRDIVTFHGPKLSTPNLFDLRLDPQIEDINDQEWIAHRIVKPLSWVYDNSSDEPDGKHIFSRAAVDAAVRSSKDQGRQFNDFQTEYYEMIGEQPATEIDPFYEESVELYATYHPRFPEFQHCIVMGREGVINWHPDQYPFAHGRQPFLMAKNTIVQGSAYGRSDIEIVESLYYELRTLHNLRLDGLTISTIPVFAKSPGMGLPELQRVLDPGAVIEGNPDGFRNLTADFKLPVEIYQEIPVLEAQLNDALATYSQIKGQTAEVGRIPATTEQGRQSNAEIRHKMNVLAIESSLQPMAIMLLGNYLEFGDPEELVRVVGDNIQELRVNRAEIAQALSLNFEFKGATQAMGRPQRVQELLGLYDKGAQYGHISPKGGVEIFKRILEVSGIHDVNSIIRPEDVDLLQEAWRAEKQGMILQTTGQPPQTNPGEPPPPDEVPLSTMNELKRGSNGTEQSGPVSQVPSPQPEQAAPQPLG